MSIYSGFVTRQKEEGYNQAVFILIRELANHVIYLKQSLSTCFMCSICVFLN